MRLPIGFALTAWLAIGLVLALQPGNPLPGQRVNDNLIPFRTIEIYWANSSDPFWIRQAIGNVLFLLPIGLLGPIVFPALDGWWRVVIAAFVFSVAVELAQLLIPDRSTDIDDVMVNVAGAVLGFVLYRLGRHVAAT